VLCTNEDTTLGFRWAGRGGAASRGLEQHRAENGGQSFQVLWRRGTSAGAQRWQGFLCRDDDGAATSVHPRWCPSSSGRERCSRTISRGSTRTKCPFPETALGPRSSLLCAGRHLSHFTKANVGQPQVPLMQLAARVRAIVDDSSSSFFPLCVRKLSN
jgi:hypothetical protein